MVPERLGCLGRFRRRRFLVAFRLRRLGRQENRRPVPKPHVDRDDVALQDARGLLDFSQPVPRRLGVVLGQPDDGAVVEVQVPAPVADPNRGLDPRRQHRLAIHQVEQ